MRWGIYLTQVTPRCSMADFRGLKGFLTAGSAHLVLRATATESTPRDLGHLWTVAGALSPFRLLGLRSPVRCDACFGVTFGRSRMREIRPYGSVRAKLND